MQELITTGKMVKPSVINFLKFKTSGCYKNVNNQITRHKFQFVT